MKRTHFLFIISLFFIFACSSPASKKSEVETLAKLDKTVIYEVSLEVDPEFTNWMGNINRKKLIENLFDDVKNNRLEAYFPMSSSVEQKMSWIDVEKAMDALNDTLDILNTETDSYEQHVVEGEMFMNEIKGVIFIEEWNMTPAGKIEKNVLGLAPVRYYSQEFGQDSIVTRKKIVFVSYFGDKKPPLFEDF